MDPVVCGVYLNPESSTLLTRRQASISLTFEGVAGDVHSGFTRGADSRTPWYTRGTPIRNDRQVSIVSVEELELIAQQMQLPQILPEWLGANLLVQGISGLTLSSWSTRLVFSRGPVLANLRENNPCIGPGKLIAAAYSDPDLAQLFPRAAAHLRGLVAVVEHPGDIYPGDLLRLA